MDSSATGKDNAGGGRQPRPGPGAAEAPGGMAEEAAATDRPTMTTGPEAADSAFLQGARAATLEASQRLLETSPQIVMKAISVLEEEVVASGLGAAKRIEQRFLNVDELRAQPPDAVMSRFRRDAHEAVDIILDVLTAATLLVGDRAGRVVNVTASRIASAAAPSPAQTGVPMMRVAAPVAAGATADLPLALENESEVATAEFTLHASELVTGSGARIPSDCVSFHPGTLAVGPRQVGQVSVQVRVPEGTPPGSYEGIVRASQLEQLRAVLLVQVV
jgi:hypothetical protein